jgi:invasion protein IalB
LTRLCDTHKRWAFPGAAAVIRTLLVAVTLMAIAVGQSFAQTNPAVEPQPVDSEPETTTATYGAWTLRCTHRQVAGTNQRFCEVDQSVVPQG